MLGTLLLLASALQEADPPRFGGFPGQDALSYELALEVHPAEKRLEGRVRYRIEAVRDLESIRLHARRGPEWSVRFLGADGEPLEASWERDSVELRLPEVAPAGTELLLDAVLSGCPPDGFEFEESRYGEPLAFTDHYSIRARGWLPCEDHPGDRARFALELLVPEGNAAIASGARVEGIGSGTSSRWETRSDIPPYMFAIAVGPYARVAEEGDERLMPHLVYRQDVERAREALVHHAEWIRILERTFGPYAYGKYAVVQCPTRWGGFEAPGNVLLSERIFDGPSRGSGTLAHELVHMWFGDAVGYAEWREVWLSEGFASYFGPWLRAQTGGRSLVESLRSMRRSWLGSREGRTRSIRWDGFEHPDRALNANTYPKGAWVLHMLRVELGDEAFFEAIAEFYRRHAGSAVVTADFTRCVEESSGRELDWFFEQWLDRRGCPRLSAAFEGGEIVIRQTQEDAPFRFRLELGWEDQAGRRVERAVRIEERRTALEVEGAVRSLTIDPDVELLFRPEG